MTISALDAFDTLAWSATTLSRLETAQAELSKKQGLKDEKAWLAAAVERVRAAHEGEGDIRDRAMRLPELEPLREEFARSLQNAVVDALERLFAGITFTAGSRAPLLEALSAKLKVPQLRRAERDDFESFCADFEKRLNSSYAKRMLGEASFAPVAPAVEQLRVAITAWRQGFAPTAPSEEEARALRDELEALARKVELPLRQARLLAEAALAPVRNAFEESGLGLKPKRRAAKPVTTEAAGAKAPDIDPRDLEVTEEIAAPKVPAVVEAAPYEVPAEPAPKKPKKSKKTEPRETP
jgi:hypothetical protein